MHENQFLCLFLCFVWLHRAQTEHIVRSALRDHIRKCIYSLANGCHQSSCVRLWVLFYLLVKVLNSFRPFLTRDVPEVEVRVWDHRDLAQRFLFFTAKSFWTTNSTSSHSEPNTSLHVFGSGSCSETFKTHHHTVTRGGWRQRQRLSEGGRTQVSNCSNTDVMKWIQIR